MSQTISISPLTRIEGHLAIHARTEPALGKKPGVKVTEVRCEGEMFRGIEKILEGRDPLDAQQITQRICGVCPIPHGIASVRAQEMAYGITPCQNGRTLQNLILAANYFHSHILHFYHLAGLDFVDVKAVLKYSGKDLVLRSLKAWVEGALARKETFPAAPFLPRYERDYVKDHDVNLTILRHYVEALDVRRACDEMAAVFGARVPHSTALVPGGCTQVPALDRVEAYQGRLKRVLAFIEAVLLPDVLEVARQFPQYLDMGRGYGHMLSFGAFEQDAGGNKFIRPGVILDGRWEALDQEGILEEVAYSRFSSPSGLHPSAGATIPSPEKDRAYSWIKAPRYKGRPMEVGPLARVLTNYHDPSGTWVKKEVDAFLEKTKIPVEKLVSVLGRHAARALESLCVAREAFRWLDQLEIDGAPTTSFKIPRSGRGYGLTEAPRGALGHWLSIEDYRIKSYQCVVPTTWNCSPLDDRGQPGPIEKAILGTTVEDPSQPIEVGRIVRSFDPCIACAVH
jgi:Ni,Fe-hydrogenase I large subunit